MPTQDKPIVLATRGSALALAQANQVLERCRELFPKLRFEIRIVKTTGDKLQTAALAANEALPKGLFTKELEVALLNSEADLAVHSLKDLPTDLPAGLVLGAAGKRADAREVLVYRDARWVAEQAAQNGPVDWTPGEPVKRGFKPGLTVTALVQGATIATSSTRRQAQLQSLRPDLRVAPIRGNVGTRLRKLAGQAAWDATMLAAAGLHRLRYRIFPDGRLLAPPGEAAAANEHPPGLLAAYVETEEMLPCVGQAAVGLEIRQGDSRLAEICAGLNHPNTFHCVTAERAFLRAMGGGCQSPVAAYAEIVGHRLRLRAVSFQDGPARRTELYGVVQDAAELGKRAAKELGARDNRPIA
jgi:hydroxymethylbilane synthase